MWTVSACSRAPRCPAIGLGVESWGLFHGLRFLSKPQRLRVLFTDDNETVIPFLLSASCTTSAHLLRPDLSLMIASTISLDSAKGLLHGRDDWVGIGWTPSILAFRIHLVMVPGETPKWRAVILTPFLWPMNAASLRTLGRYGFFVYMLFILLLSVSKVLNHYGPLDLLNSIWYHYKEDIPSFLYC